MGWPQCNTTLEDMRINEVPIWHGHTFHNLGLWLSAIFGAVAILVSFGLIYLHATHYLRPHEQRHIIRILFMVPIYAAVSFLSYYYYRHSVYFEVIRDCYEAFAIASFFSLMCAYLAEDLHNQKEYFRTIKPKSWIWPMRWIQKCCGGDHGKLRTPRSGLTWFNVIWVCVFQYCFIRVAMTIVAVVTQTFDRYCLESLNPAFSHIWVMVIEAVAVTIAMYCLIQFYIQIKGDIREHHPLQKITAIKLVIFLSFWQNILISFLTSTGAIKPSDKFQTPDIKIGIPSMLLCIEMALFAIFHIFAFSWRPYVVRSTAFQQSTAVDGKSTPTHYAGGFLGVRAIIDAFNPWDLVKAVGRSARWLFVGRKKRLEDTSYESADGNGNSKLTGTPLDLNLLQSATSYKSSSHGASWPEDHENLLSTQRPTAYQQPANEQGQDFMSFQQMNTNNYSHDGDIGVAHTTSDMTQYYQAPSRSSQTYFQHYDQHSDQHQQDYNMQSHTSLPSYRVHTSQDDIHQHPREHV